MTVIDELQCAYCQQTADGQQNGKPICWRCATDDPPGGDLGEEPLAAAPSAHSDTDLDESLQPIDLSPVLDGSAIQPMPSQLIRDDGAALFYAGYVNGIHGDSGAGKGWLICHLIVQNAARGQRTMLLDLEDTPESITARLGALGMSHHEILTWVVYIRPQVPLGPAAVDHLCQLVVTLNIAAVVIDSLGEAFGLEGINEDKDVEVGPWLRRVTRPLADTGAAVTTVDHSTKASDNPLHPSGSKRKRAAITGASYHVEAIKPYVKGEGGRVRLTCAKDRHGNYRRGQAVGDLVMDSTTNSVRLSLYAPIAKGAELDATVPTILAARAAVNAARDEGRTLSQNELVGLMAIKGGSEMKRGGVDYAVAAGALTETAGPRNARLFTYLQDLDGDTNA